MKISNLSNPEENQRDGINFTAPCFKTTHWQMWSECIIKSHSTLSMNSHMCKHTIPPEKTTWHGVHYHISPFYRLNILTLMTEVLQTCKINYCNVHTSIINDGNLQWHTITTRPRVTDFLQLKKWRINV